MVIASTSVISVEEHTDMLAPFSTIKSPTKWEYSAAWFARSASTIYWPLRTIKGPTLTLRGIHAMNVGRHSRYRSSY